MIFYESIKGQGRNALFFFILNFWRIIMRKLGVSVYPDQMEMTEMKEYLSLCHSYQFNRVFTSLLHVEDEQDRTINKYKEIIHFAKKLDMFVVIDVNPKIFNLLHISYDDLSFFSEMGVDGIRLDEGFTGLEEARMTNNPFNLKIELNISRGTHYIDQVMDYSPNTDNLIGCHNFYPQSHTGLSENFLKETSKEYKKYNIKTAAFINSRAGKIGINSVGEGMLTLESDRNKDIVAQTSHLKILGCIDDIIIANAKATSEELRNVYEEFWCGYPMIRIDVKDTISEMEDKILFDNDHLYRGDVSDYVIRSTENRGNNVKEHDNHENIKKGDILVLNNKYQQYSGELQIAFKDFENNGKINVVGKAIPDDLNLIDNLKPWQSFLLKNNKFFNGEF